LLELEYSGADYATMGALARRTVPAGSLSAETGRDLARSPRWDEILRPVGIGDEAALACRDALGCWGWIKAYRDSGDPAFSEHDLELLAAVGPRLGSALRRRIGGVAPAADGPPSAPGVIVLDRDLRAVSSTAGARDWAAALPAASVFPAWGMLPAVVYPAAVLARSGSGAKQAHALERPVGGRWVTIEAAPLDGQDGERIAVVLRGRGSRRDVRAALPGVRAHDARAAGGRGVDRRRRHPRDHGAPRDLAPHRAGPPGVRLHQARREQPARGSRALQRRDRDDIDTTNVTPCVTAPTTRRLRWPGLSDDGPEARAAARTHCTTSRRLVRRSQMPAWDDQRQLCEQRTGRIRTAASRHTQRRRRALRRGCFQAKDATARHADG
jgi:hypothetical protein